MITAQRPGIVVMREAWQVQPDMVCINEKIMFHNLRTNRRDGDVAMLVHESLRLAALQVNVPAELEVPETNNMWRF